MEARQADVAGYISPPWAGTFHRGVAKNVLDGTFSQISRPIWRDFH